MALPRFLAAFAVCAVLAAGPALADEIGDIRKQFQGGDLAGALERADRYLAAHPENAQARFLKSLILADQGKSEPAIALLDGLTNDYPELPEPYNNLAVIYAAQGRYELALATLEKAIIAHPGYATAHENLGDIHAKLAAAAYEKAQSLDPKNTTAKMKVAQMRALLEKQVLNPAPAPFIEPLPQAR